MLPMVRLPLFAFWVLVTTAAAQSSAADVEWFEKTVRPVLAERCHGCHGAERQRSGLRLDHISSVLRGGSNGPAIEKGDPDSSRLLRAIRYDDVTLRMPPKGRLPDAEVAILEEWVRRGAPWPDEPLPSKANDDEGFDLAERRESHWCWAPLSKPSTPPIADKLWARSPIDAFVRNRLELDGLKPGPEADRSVLVRRLSFALRGLPPTAEEVNAFVADESDDAYEEVVDRYLASPRFGERWGRHWLDLMRYAESYGHEFDYNIAYPWEYRDYIIRAFNEDVPYDQLVREHVAGDLLTEPRRNPDRGFNESVLGTGFWHFHQATHAPVDVRMDEAEKIDNQIDVLSKTFLGLTVSCARCHDHKFDAISTADYYALSGYLQSSRRQVAHLDVNGEIEKASKSLDALRAKAGSAVADLRFPEQAARYYEAGKRGLALAPPDRGKREAEELKQRALSAGKYRPQPWKGLSGDQHMHWTGGAPGATLELTLPVPEAGRYRIELGLTSAPDYATVRIKLDEKVIKEKDLYHKNVRSTGPLKCGEHHLSAGDHGLLFEITGANEKAVKNYMVGFDWVRLIPVEGSEAALSELAAEYKLELGELRAWMDAAASPPHHPPIPRDEDVVFADSRKDGFRSWMLTGQAFTRAGGWYGDGPRGRVAHPTLDSRLRSHRHQGAARSPTFTITKPHVLYRIAGENAKVRLIIDGYMMNVHNPLLFGGIAFDVRTGGRWRWHHQGSDVRNYIGHSAYIEVLDDGDGWVALDQVLFSDHGPPAEGDARDLANPAAYAAGASDPVLADWGLRFGIMEGADVLTPLAEQWRQTGQAVPRAMRALAMCDGTPEDEYVFIRGKHQNKGPFVPRRFLEALGGARPSSEGSGRLDLADAMMNADNPLPARVMANRIWHHLFGVGIVPTVDDFGVLGSPPTHPLLLDWLASTFREDRWSVKRLIRRIVLSSTWRMDSRVTDPAAEKQDPSNELLHRMRVLRLQGEAIRDGILSVSGRLDTTMYGRSVDQHLTSFMTGRGRPGRSGPLDGNGRRSIYVAVRRNFLDPFFLAFDGPMTHTATGRRSVSNVPAQALAMMNHPLVAQEAKRWAEKATATESDPAERVRSMYLRALSRHPDADELNRVQGWLKEQAGSRQDRDWKNDLDTWADLAHVLYNSKEFLFVR